MKNKFSMSKNLVKKLSTASVSVFLCIVMVFVAYGSIMGKIYAYGSTYIGEMKVFSGDTLSAAIEKCKKAGYTAVKKNINRSEDGDDEDNGIYIVGYKTTDNPDEAITDISLLQMNSGYQDYTYGDVAEQAIDKLGVLPYELVYSVDEFVKNYKNNSPAAVSAVEALNCYYIDEMNQKPLGDYLVSGECTVDFIKKLLARSGTAVVSSVCNALVAGVAEYGEDNWASRLCSCTEFREQLENAESYSEFDTRYSEYAKELSECINDFSSSFLEAESRYYQNNKKVDVPESDEKDVTDMPDEIADDMANGGEIQTEDGDSFVLYAYDILNTYKYDETTGLGEYLVSLGKNSFETFDSLRELYPFVYSITDGQVATMRLNGIAFSAIYLINEDGLCEKADEQIKAIKKDIKSETGKESLSIWVGTDQTIYNEKVAVTSAAYRANSAGQIYNTLTAPDDVDTVISESLSKLRIIMSVVGFCYGITSAAALTVGSMSAMAVGSVGLSASIWTVCCASVGSGVLGSILGVLGCAIIVLNYIAIAAMVIIFVAMFVKWIWDMCTDDDAEEFSPIPKILFDVADNRYIKYEAINEGENPANINGENARRWNALYYTKSSYAGEPICSSEAEDLLSVQYNNSSTPLGYEPVKCFGEVYAANLNANSKSDSTSIYLFYKTTDKEINEGEKQEGNTYISKLSLSVEGTETAAKAALTKSGYNVIDINLTPCTADDEKYTYLGFTTTTNAQDAITDIRISPRNSAESFYFGNASYTSCGTTPTGDTLYYTSYETAGSPILSDIKIVESLKDAPDGYEPVNMFCGGNAFNLNTGSEMENIIYTSSKSVEYDDWNNKGRYIYFKPSVMYTEGEEYISGIVLVAGTKATHGINSADDYCNALGLTKFDNDLTYGWEAQVIEYDDDIKYVSTIWSDVETYICYTTTHNPYRAIYGMKSYTCSPGCTNAPACLGSSESGAYAVCDIMFELPYSCKNGKKDIDEFMRGIYDSHSYQFASCSGESTGIYQTSSEFELSPEDYEATDWASCGARGKGLYVLGPVKGGTPLTADDIAITDDSTVPDGFSAVQDFKTPYRTEAHNLGYSTSDTKDKEKAVYLYLKQAAPQKATYISSIKVVSYSLKKASGVDEDKLEDDIKDEINKTCNDYCIQSLISQGYSEIIQSNIAIDKSKSVYGNSNYSNYTATYIGVTRTDIQTNAITGIIRYIPSNGDAPATITVGGVAYTKAGDKVCDPKGAYYLYYATAKGSNPGMPVTDIDIGSEVFSADCATAMTANDVDIPDVKEGKKIITKGTKATLYGDVKETNYIHMSYEDTATMMSAVYVGHGKTRKEAQCSLLSLGCNMCIDLDLNKDAGGEYVYIGYTRYTITPIEIKQNTIKYAVQDIILTVGEEHQATITVNGVTYKPARDEYTSVKNYDGVKAVSLNSGTGGKQIYLYYSTTKTDETTDLVARLGASCRDYSMLNTDDYKWENILDKNGNKVNVNEGVISTDEDGEHIIDNRIYLYASRCNNTVKESAAVSQGEISSEYKTYDVYMKGVTAQ